MDIYEYWCENRHRIKLQKLIVGGLGTEFVTSSGYATLLQPQMTADNLERLHVQNTNTRFLNHMINQKINPVALGYAPISR